MDESDRVETEIPESAAGGAGSHNAGTPEAPRGVFAALDELLRRPGVVIARSRLRTPSSLVYLLLGALACCVVYGAASGFFQGGGQILVTAFKAPLIIFGSLLLCLPSFYVFSSLAGAEVSGRWLATAMVGLGAMLGLLLVGLMPIAWLFSVSSRSLPFIVVLHFAVWVVAIGFGYRFLALAFRGVGGLLALWILLFSIVSFQVASQMRPVLLRPAEVPLFAPQKM
ncbi:MAG: hypothetical protein GY856_21330, partial [bacterium]|nr:hypothetical protein [bacterium]